MVRITIIRIHYNLVKLINAMHWSSGTCLQVLYATRWNWWASESGAERSNRPLKHLLFWKSQSWTSSTRQAENSSSCARGLASGSGATVRLKQHLVASALQLPDTPAWLLIKGARLWISSPRATGLPAPWPGLPIWGGGGAGQCSVQQ